MMETVADVQTWLEDKGFSEYKEKFLDQKIDGLVLKNISERALETLVPIIGDRVRLSVALKELSCDDHVITFDPPVEAGQTVKQLDEAQKSPAPVIRKPSSSPKPGMVVLNAKLPWPSKIVLPTNFRPDLAQVLAAGDAAKFSSKFRSQFIYLIFEHFSRYTLYPTKHQLTEISLAIINQYPFLKDKQVGSGYDSWFSQLYDKFRNERRTSQDAEVILHKRKGVERSVCSPEPVKKSLKRGALNWTPPFPVGEDEVSLAKHVEYMQNEWSRRNPDKAKIRKRMALTFPGRRRFMNVPKAVADVKSEYPALFDEKELLYEFERILGATEVGEKFMQNMHGIAPCLVSLAKEISAPKEEVKQLLNLLEQNNEEDGVDEDMECSEDEVTTVALALLAHLLGKNSKDNYRMIHFIKPDEDIQKTAEALSTGCPRIVIQGTLDSPGNMALVADKMVICEVSSLEDGVLSLMAACYIFMFEYPASIRGACTYLQRCCLDVHDGKKLPATIITFINKLEQKKVQE